MGPSQQSDLLRDLDEMVRKLQAKVRELEDKVQYHVGSDAPAAGGYYPHTNQLVNSMVFAQGAWRADQNGLEFAASEFTPFLNSYFTFEQGETAGVSFPAIWWLRTHSENPIDATTYGVEWAYSDNASRISLRRRATVGGNYIEEELTADDIAVGGDIWTWSLTTLSGVIATNGPKYYRNVVGDSYFTLADVNYSIISSAAGAPTGVPAYAGSLKYDSTNGKIYYSTATEWKLVGGAMRVHSTVDANTIGTKDIGSDFWFGPASGDWNVLGTPADMAAAYTSDPFSISDFADYPAIDLNSNGDGIYCNSTPGFGTWGHMRMAEGILGSAPTKLCLEWDAKWVVHTASETTSGLGFIVGGGSPLTAANHVAFICSDGTNFILRSSGAADIGAVDDGNWHKFKIVLNSAAVTAEWFIDGTSQGTIALLQDTFPVIVGASVFTTNRIRTGWCHVWYE